jgi:anti-repressor protein
MPNPLFPVVTRLVGTTTIPTVNARELHEFLGSKRQFADWIKDNIENYGFVENQDFVTYSQICEKPRGGRPALDYALSLDMGKELSMVERNAKGKQARQYFIECERIAKTPIDPHTLLNDPAAMRGVLLTYVERVIDLEAKVTKQDNLLATIQPKMIELVDNVAERDKLIATIQPKAEAFAYITTSEGSACIQTTAKILGFMKIKECFAWLHEIKYIFKRNGEWIAHQDKLREGLLEEKVYTFEKSDGSKGTRCQALVTPKGLAKLAVLLKTNPPAYAIVGQEVAA